MLLGIMASTVHPEHHPLDLKNINLVTFFRIPKEIAEFSASLSIFKISDGMENLVSEHSADYTCLDPEESPYQWTSVSNLQIDNVSLSHGDSLKAELSVRNQCWETFLTCGASILDSHKNAPLDKTNQIG